jgi:hypothetical protein
MNITIPHWVVSILCYSAVTVAILLFVGLLVFGLNKAILWLLKANGIWWAIRVYWGLKIGKCKPTDLVFDEVIPKLIAEWGNGHTERYLTLRRSMDKLRDTLPSDEGAFINRENKIH